MYEAAVRKVEDRFTDTTEPHQKTVNMREAEARSVQSKAPSQITSVKDDPPKPKTQPKMNVRFYAGQGAMGELRYTGRGVIKMLNKYEIFEEMFEIVSQPATKTITVVYSVEEVSKEVYKSVETVVKGGQVKHTSELHQGGNGRMMDTKDAKRGRFWQSVRNRSESFLLPATAYKVAEWKNVEYKEKAEKGNKDKMEWEDGEFLEDVTVQQIFQPKSPRCTGWLQVPPVSSYLFCNSRLLLVHMPRIICNCTMWPSRVCPAKS